MPGQPRKRGIAIRASLALLVLATALPFVALIGYTAYQQVHSGAEQARDAALRAARGVALEAERTLQRTSEVLRFISQQPLVRALDPQRCDAIFKSFRGLYSEYTNLVSVRRNAERVCSAVTPPPGAPAKVDPKLYLEQTLRSQSFTVGRVARGVFTGRWIMIVAHPITDETGQIQGVMGLSIDLANLRLAPGPAELPQGGLARIVDANGVLIGSSADPDKWIGRNMADVPWFKLLGSDAPVTGRAKDVEGVERIYGVMPIKGTKWHAAVGIPVDVVYAPVKSALLLTAVFSLVALALAGCFAYLTARRIARPVEAIAASAREAAHSKSASGRDLADIRLTGAPAEVQMLASDLHSMLKARAQAERKLRESEERLRVANEAAGIGTYDTDLAAGQTRYSPELAAIFGLAPDTSMPLEEAFRMVHAEDLDEVLLRYDAANDPAGDGIARLEFRIVRPDGELRWLSWSGHTLFRKTPAGRVPVRAVGACFDITDRKRAEEAVLQRTEELSRSNTELEQFAYVASHDMQEPLRIVTSFAELLRRRYRDKLDQGAQEFIDFIVDGATRMRQLIDDLLALSRVGTRGGNFAPVSSAQTVERALGNLRVAIAESGAEITLDALPELVADARQLTQLFQNLIGNAIKFHGGATPRIQVSAKVDFGEYVFSIRDNGIGIRPRDFERIFIVFNRLHGREQYPGTGIGLAICKKIVERHRGRIWVESVEGEGSTFHFTIAKGLGARGC